jgi:hypothetical protein
VDVDDVQAVKQVFPKRAALASRPEIDVRGNDIPHVHVHVAHAADPHDLPFLEDPQDLGLEQGRNIADLVKKYGAPVRLFQEALFRVLRPGERALLVPEELRLKERVGSRCN